MSDSMHVFDRAAVLRHRRRAAASPEPVDFLYREAAKRLADRLLDVTRTFDMALEFGARGTFLTDLAASSGKVRSMVGTDSVLPRTSQSGRLIVSSDAEALPFRENSFDLILSNLGLHWINDVPGTLIQLRHSLKPDGLLLVSTFGTETLRELRTALLEAESEICGGASPRVSPFIDVRDAGSLLGRAGFALPVVDADVITVTYPDMFRLMADLRAMGETNAANARNKHFSRRDMFARAADIYAERFSDHRGRIVTTFQIVTMTAWAPHASQQKPLRPGSAANRLADALESTEIPLPGNRPAAQKGPH
ncbi:MAG: methyltransferase domain-containing protein [Rhodobacteraceae bacterium]|nr:methyltransferase domain-containing protein [Paracoccaceae bacterium]